MQELLHLHPLYNEQLRSFAAFGGDFHDLSRLADMGASLTSADETALQAVLEELQVPAKCASYRVSFVLFVGRAGALALEIHALITCAASCLCCCALLHMLERDPAYEQCTKSCGQ